MTKPSRPPGPSAPEIVRFGPFELNMISGDLRRRGRLVTLQEQQAVVLKHLVERAASTVTREELRVLIWPEGTYVEFEFGLYNTINRLRRALGDSASSPIFIETVPKQGYRFIAAVDFAEDDQPFALPPIELLAEASHLSAEPGKRTEPHETGELTPLAIQKSRSRILIASGMAVLLLAALLFWSWPWIFGAASSGIKQVYRYAIPITGVEQVASLAISPAGDQIVFQGPNRMLYRRYLDLSDSRLIRGTEDGRSPFFSPDGQNLGFFTDRQLKILEAGHVRVLAELPTHYEFWDAVWAADGFIYFNTQVGNAQGIWRVPVSGGKTEPVVGSVDSGHGLEVPLVNQVLTKPRHLLVYSINIGPVRRSLHVRDLDTHVDKMVVERGIGGRVLPDGHLTYYYQGSVFAVPFNERSLSVSGTAVEMVKDVASYRWQSGRAALSDTGTLAYVSRPELPLQQLKWIDSSGRITPVPVPADRYEQAEASPAGDLLAIVRQEELNRSSLWTYELRTGAWRKIMDSHVPLLRAQWNPAGTELVVSSEMHNEDFVNLYRVPLSDPRAAQRLTQEPDNGQFPLSWSEKAHAILFIEGTHEVTKGDILVLPLGTGQVPKRLVATRGWDRAASFSPDGNKFVYESDDQGQPEIFVRAYNAEKAEAAGPAIQISSAGGHDPVWSPNGESIYYLDRAHRLLQALLSDSGTPVSIRTVAESISMPSNPWTRELSMAPDGRLLVRVPVARTPVPAEIQVVVNWGEELKHLTPVK